MIYLAYLADHLPLFSVQIELILRAVGRFAALSTNCNDRNIVSSSMLLQLLFGHFNLFGAVKWLQREGRKPIRIEPFLLRSDMFFVLIDEWFVDREACIAEPFNKRNCVTAHCCAAKTGSSGNDVIACTTIERYVLACK